MLHIRQSMRDILSGLSLRGNIRETDKNTGLYAFKMRPDTDKSESKYRSNSDNYYYYLGTSNAPVTGGYVINFGYKRLSLSVSGNYSIGAKITDEISSPASYSIFRKTVNQDIPTSHNDL